MEWGLGRDVNNSLKSNKMMDIVMAYVGSGRGEQWHCFWPVNKLESEKPVVFMVLYWSLKPGHDREA